MQRTLRIRIKDKNAISEYKDAMVKGKTYHNAVLYLTRFRFFEYQGKTDKLDYDIRKEYNLEDWFNDNTVFIGNYFSYKNHFLKEVARHVGTTLTVKQQQLIVKQVAQNWKSFFKSLKSPKITSNDNTSQIQEEEKNDNTSQTQEEEKTKSEDVVTETVIKVKPSETNRESKKENNVKNKVDKKEKIVVTKPDKKSENKDKKNKEDKEIKTTKPSKNGKSEKEKPIENKKPDVIKPNKPNETKPEDKKPDVVKPDKPNETKPEDKKPDVVKPNKPDKTKPENKKDVTKAYFDDFDKTLYNGSFDRMNLGDNSYDNFIDAYKNSTPKQRYQYAQDSKYDLTAIYDAYSDGRGFINYRVSNAGGQHTINAFNTEKIFNENLYTQEITKLVNKERTRLGLKPLTINYNLKQGADTRSMEQAEVNSVRSNGLSHTRPNGTKYYTAFDYLYGKDSKYSVGENIAANYRTSNPYQVMSEKHLAELFYNQWKNSPGHYNNMIDPMYSSIYVSVKMTDHYENQSAKTPAYISTMILEVKY